MRFPARPSTSKPYGVGNFEPVYHFLDGGLDQVQDGGPYRADKVKGAEMSTTGHNVVAAQIHRGQCPSQGGPAQPLNPCELEIDLFCKGMRIDPSCSLGSDARFISRTRAGLGSGLELVIPGPIKDVWVNVPVEEDFAQQSCYELVREQGEYWVKDARTGHRYGVRVPPEPAWYTCTTSRGTAMHKVGVLQGTYLGIYISNSCGFWYHSPAVNCKFCATGLNVGVNEVARKDVDDVVEVARAAKQESGVTFVHFNSGYQKNRDLDEAAPYVKAVKSRVGTLVGLPHQPKLARPAARQLSGHRRPDRCDDHQDWPYSPLRDRSKPLPKGRHSLRCRDGRPQHHAPRVPWRMELHHRPKLIMRSSD